MSYFESGTNIKDWDDNVEDIIKMQKNRCACYKFIHHQESERLSTINNAISIFNILLVSITATAGIITNNTIFENDKWVFVLNIIDASLLYTSALLISFQNYFNFEKEAEKNKRVSLLYTGLFSNIKRMLSLDKHNRHQANDYFNWVNKEFEAIFTKSPDISKNVLEKFNKKYGKDYTVYIKDLDIIDIANTLEVFQDDPRPIIEKEQEQVKNVKNQNINIIERQKMEYELARFMVHDN